ncbi:MarR family winged helix-turn-helix transcriptional regulator [Saccharibacillus sp. CPCC 101409]|uniref:MarR family winged helix-turn-helix transcriptional regulator n=1 Tax=Saccharibacillus sp. CPCC 101409 TaxID=3058041 RepID=UPI0026719B8B|nr:MarR family winged helix-turn-helix transcriptional regulator [Saccharibacillus sp. CPCC 101409]MDO3408401.1 MarR family winged helix-turn-helix transcriptional regulator [Saccharibacillus sp. CPCC 101409]
MNRKIPEHPPDSGLPSPSAISEFSAGDRSPVSFAVFALGRSHRALAAQMLREIGLFAGQEIILFQLWDRDGQSQNSLGQALRLDHSTIAKSVKRLEESGLVNRSRSQEDGRVTLVSLTDEGRAINERITGVWQRMEEITTRGLTDAERSELIRLASKAAANVDAELK